MSKKAKKRILFTSFFPILALTPFFFLSSGMKLTQAEAVQQSPGNNRESGGTNSNDNSASGGKNGKTDGESSSPESKKDGKSGNKKEEKKAEPITEEDLKKNQAWWNAQKSSLIDNFLQKVDQDIKIKLADINSKTRDNVEERLKQSFFWIQLRYYFKKNAEGIKKNPQEYGLNIISPFAFANNLKLKRGDVSFEKENHQGLEWGSNENDDYAKVKGVKTDKVTEVPNTLKGKEFEERIKTYFQGLESGYKQYLFKEEEFPEYKKNFDLNIDPDRIDAEESLLLASKPKGKEGVSSWNDWIKNYFEKQSLLLDFSLNQLPNPSSSQSAQEQINLAIKKITNQNPPDVAEKPEFEVRIAPDLPPIVAAEYANMSASEIVSLYNSASQEEKKKIFFFLNPLNSRFKYDIQSVEEKDGKVSAKIKITDFVNKVRDANDKSKYEKVYDSLQYDDFDGATGYQKQAITANLYRSNLGVTAVIDEFFKTINVNDQFSFDQIRYYSPGSQTTIYNFFYLLTKVFYNEDFLNAQKKMAREYINSSQATVFSASQFQFLSYLKKAEIDNNKAWSHYYLIYFLNLIVLQDKFYQATKKITANSGAANQKNQAQTGGENQSEEEKKLEETLKKLNITRQDINRFFAEAHQKVALFHNESHKLTSNLVNSFLAMTKIGRQINQLNQILGQIAYFDEKDNKPSTSGNDNKTEGQSQKPLDPVQNFANLIEEYKNSSANEWIANNLVYLLIGGITLVLISVATISRLLIYKKNQIKTSEKIKGDE